MSWVVDTCLVIDILENDPEHGLASAHLIERSCADGLTLCPVSYVELAPAFLGDMRRQNDFLAAIGIDFSQAWDWRATQAAHQAWNRQIGLRRERKSARRLVADILIGAFALGQRGLLTRNPADFRQIFADLKIVGP
jgi:predicted nucleic acid-binding protein